MLDKIHKPFRQLISLIGIVILIVGILLMVTSQKQAAGSDFGNVPKVAGYGCWEEIKDCTGDTDLLTIDAIDWSRSTDGSIAVRTTPTCLLSLTSQPLDDEGYAAGEGDSRGMRGYAEKKVGDSWEYVGEIDIWFVAYVSYSVMDWVPTPDAFYVYVKNETDRLAFREIRVILPEYEPGATYRINYFFRSQIDKEWSDEVYTVSHTVTLPEQTESRFDFISLGWVGPPGSHILPEIRANDGEVPYLLLNACKMEKEEDGRWVESLDSSGNPLFWTWFDEPPMELTPCQRVPNHYTVFLSFGYSAVIDPNVQNYRLTLVFCDNADGSGERYTLTLYLNTEMLAEYR